MQKKIIFILTLLFSCNKIPDAVGTNNEIIILSSLNDKDSIQDKITNFFSIYLKTPTDEPIYKLKWIDPLNFKDFSTHKNILAVSLDEPKDSTVDYLFSQFDFKKNEHSAIFTLDDFYSSGQTFIFLNSTNSNEFGELLKDYGQFVLNEFNENIENNILENYLKNNKNLDLNKIISDKYSLNMHIDENYLKIKENSDFLWIGRGYPYRWLFFDIVNNVNDLDIWSLYINSISENVPGLNISPHYRSESVDDNFIILRGVYDYDQSDTGGPFFVYVFDNYIDNSLILVSGFVSNPGKDKYLLLKELELLIKNIKGKI